MNWDEIGEAIASQFEACGIRRVGFVPSTISPPCLFVNFVDCEPHTMRRGWFVANYDVFILTATSSDRAGQNLLRELTSPTGSTSVWTVFGTNNDLDATDGTAAELLRYRTLSIEELAAYPYYGGALEVRVTTPGV